MSVKKSNQAAKEIYRQLEMYQLIFDSIYNSATSPIRMAMSRISKSPAVGFWELILRRKLENIAQRPKSTTVTKLMDKTWFFSAYQ